MTLAQEEREKKKDREQKLSWRMSGFQERGREREKEVYM